MYVSAVKALTALVVVSLTLTITTFIRSEEHIKATLQHLGSTGTRGTGYGGTSLSNVTLNTDEPKTFVLDTVSSYAYAANQRVRASHSESVYVEGTVVSYTASTRCLVVELDIIIGEIDTSYANWTLGLIGMPGIGYAAVSYSTVLMDNSGDDKTFVLEPLGHYDFTPVQYVRCLETVTYNWMDGHVVSYNQTSRTLVVMPMNATDTGTYSNWSIHLAGEQNVQGATGITGNGYGGTSTTSLTIGTGSHTFTLSTGHYAYTANMRVRAANDTTHYMEGTVISYSAYSLVVNVDRTVGTGTFENWTLGLVGDVGAQGEVGETGDTGSGYGGTSTTSNTIGTGSMVFAVTNSTTLAYAVGMRVRIANSASDYVEGVITEFSDPSLTLTVDQTGGVGTFSSWTIGIAGDVGLQGLTYTTTSTTSITIGTGSKAFTVAALSAYAVGLRVRCANSASNYVEGPVDSYSHPTLILTADHTAGSGTFASWTCGLAGDVGATGSTGATGAGYGGTSTSSVLVGLGTKTFTLDTTGYAYVVGQRVRVANGGTYMEGTVSTYSGTTLTISADASAGSGTLSSWTIGAAGIRGSNGVDGADYDATSTTSNTIGTGAKTFTVSASGKAYLANMRVRIANSASNYLEGTVTSYSGTSLVINADRAIGSGTYTSWTVGLAGDVGDGYGGTSTTSLSITVASKSVVLAAGNYAYSAGMRVRVANSGTNYMEGPVTSYTTSTLTLVVNVDRISGSGTFASWNVGLAGDPGIAGTWTNGQLPIGNTATGTFALATLTQGTGITVTNGAASITLSIALTAGYGISVSGATVAVSAPKLWLLREQYSGANTPGNTVTTGGNDAGVQNRLLNTVAINGGTEVTLDTTTGVFTIVTTGTYEFEVSTPAYNAGAHMAILSQNGGDVSYGSWEFTETTAAVQTRSTILYRAYIGGGTTYRVKHYFANHHLVGPITNGLGAPPVGAGYPHSYAQVKITRLTS